MYSYDRSRASRRSRSPVDRPHHKRHRSPHSHRHHGSSRISNPATAPVHLPFQASPLNKGHYSNYKLLFGLYLDIQKQKVLEDLSEDEVRGRWKSFIGKWNRGELAEGWYDPATLNKAQASAAQNDESLEPLAIRESPDYGPSIPQENSDEDLVGPSLPNQELAIGTRSKNPGPGIPNLQDLELQRELQKEDTLAHRRDLKHERRLDRASQKQRLNDLIPLADPGTKARLLEKKREKADSNRAFAAAKTETGGLVEEVPESDLLGDDGDGGGGIEGFRKQKREMERKKNEREVRKEEVLRARREEREERIRNYRDKEERTMSGLVALARARFG